MPNVINSGSDIKRCVILISVSLAVPDTNVTRWAATAEPNEENEFIHWSTNWPASTPFVMYLSKFLAYHLANCKPISVYKSRYVFDKSLSENNNWKFV